MIRVLHLHSGNLSGGVETLLLTLADGSAADGGMEMRIALCFEGSFAGGLRGHGLAPEIVGPVRARYPWTVWRARRRLRALLAERRPDVVVCHMPWNHAVFAPVVRAARLPLVLWLHGVATGRHWVERWARRTPPDLVICNSDYARSRQAHLFPHSRVERLYYPVAASAGPAASRRDGIRQSLGASPDQIVVLQASRMEPWKGQEVLLRALGTLRDRDAWVCWIAGGAQRPAEAAYLQRLRRVARELDIEHRVKFLGHRTDARELMAAADVFCQPNVAPEPFGIVFVEALQARLPVVTTATGGALEIIDEETGLLVDRPDPVAVAAAVARLADDAALRARLGAAGPAAAARITDVGRQTQRLRTLLETVARPATSTLAVPT